MTGLPPNGLLDAVPAAALEEACWWEQHIVEVLTGLVPGGVACRPEFDPQQRTLTEREAAKAAELSAAGRSVTARGVQDRRRRCEAQGLFGLVDRRAMRQESVSVKRGSDPLS